MPHYNELYFIQNRTEAVLPNYVWIWIYNLGRLYNFRKKIHIVIPSLQKLFEGAIERKDCGIAAAVTTDEDGNINFPYLYAKKRKSQVFDEKKRFSFCCTLLTIDFLKAFDFHLLDASKNWFDVTISHESLKKGFHNYLFINLPVIHRPHGSRPWKKMKYTNPLKYYWLKYTKGLDKI